MIITILTETTLMAPPPRSSVAILIILLVLLMASVSAKPASRSFGGSAGGGEAVVRRSDFPPSFVFGSATSAYQVEGAAREDGKWPSIWDTFTHKYPNRIANGSNGDIAIDQYHRYKEDIRLLKSLGMNAYRFSISWSRILPRGSLEGGLNMQGIVYYNNLINEIISNGMQPFATLFHWDVPQALEDAYGGFLSPRIVRDFEVYAGICFKEYGDRVKHWITVNEPNIFATQSYGNGNLAPGRCSAFENSRCAAGDSGREPYVVLHNQLLAHATAVKLYRDQFQKRQKGSIGAVVNAFWMVPYTDSKADEQAAERAMDFGWKWILDPLTQGQYPFSMRALVRDRLPRFTPEQSRLVNMSFDFIGVNYYTSNYAAEVPLSTPVNVSYFTDSYARTIPYRNGKPIGTPAASGWLFVYSKGLRELLRHIKREYNNPTIYITENGVDELDNVSLPLEEALKDDYRIDFYERHLKVLRKSIRNGADVRGFFAWSMFDNFEWNNGYTCRFGLYYVDYRHGLRRHPKNSARWFTKFLKGSDDPLIASQID